MMKMTEKELIEALEEARSGVSADRIAEDTYWCYVDVAGCRITLPFTPIYDAPLNETGSLEIEHDSDSAIDCDLLGTGFALSISQHMLIEMEDGSVLETDPEDPDYDWPEAVGMLLSITLEAVHEACREAIHEEILIQEDL